MNTEPPVSDEYLLSGACGEIGGLVMIKRELEREWLAKTPGARIDGSFRTAEQQLEWQAAQAEFYEGLEYTPTLLPRVDAPCQQ